MDKNTQNGYFGKNGSHHNATNGLGAKVPADLSHYLQENELDFKKIFNSLYRYKWLLLGLVVLSTTLAGLFANYVTPIYQSSGTIMISESRNRYSYAGSDLNNLLTSTYGLGVGSTISNELFIIKSRKMSEAVAEQLLETKYMPNGKLFPIITFRDTLGDLKIAPKPVITNRIRSGIGASRVERSADLVTITFSSASPYESANLVNTVINTYSRISTEQNRIAARSALNFLKKERQKVEKSLKEVENELKQFMDQNQLVQIDAQTTQIIDMISQLISTREELRVKQVAINSAIDKYSEQIENLRQGLANQLTNAVSPLIDRFQFRLAELETERILLLTKNPELEDKPNHPKLVELNDQIVGLKRKIDELANKLIAADESGSLIGTDEGSLSGQVLELRRVLLGLNIEQNQYAAQIEVLTDRIKENEAFFEALPENMIAMARLQRDVKINEELFLTISRQYAETSLWEQTQFGLGKPLDYAIVPKRPVKPRKILYLFVGFIFGASAGLLFIFIRESTSRKIRGSEDLKSKPIPLLAVIPNLEEWIQKQFKGKKSVEVKGKEIASRLVTLTDSISPMAEAFRRLRNNIIYSNPDKTFKCLMITSANKGEGKSTALANLAISLTEMGRDVVLIDLDLRRPTVHRVFGERKSSGVKEYLFGEEDLEEIIKPTVVNKLSIITSGEELPDPSSSMQSQKLKSMIAQLTKKFDHVLLDTPPYGLITDAAGLMQAMDGVIIVSRFQHTLIDEFDDTLDNLIRMNINVLGSVLTAYDPKTSTDYYSAKQYKRSMSQYYDYQKG